MIRQKIEKGVLIVAYTTDEMRVIRVVWETWKEQQSQQKRDAVRAKTLRGVKPTRGNANNKDAGLSAAGPLVANAGTNLPLIK